MISDLSQLGFLLFVSALVAMLTRRLHMPYTVGLVLAGMGLYFAHIFIKWHLTKDLIFSVFLPPLVFEAALFISWQEFKRDLPVVALLASVGVLLAAAVTAAGMHYALNWDWGSAVVFGVLIAATDPVSVIATFKEARVHGRLRLLIEAESLLNDGTAAVAFVAVLGVLAGATSGFSIDNRHAAVDHHRRCAHRCHRRRRLHAPGRAYTGLLGRDHLYHTRRVRLVLCCRALSMSGVLATLTAGLVVGNFRSPALITDTGRRALESFWEYVAFIANSLIFLLIGAQEAQQHFKDLWFPVLVAILLVTLGRAVAIYPLCAVFSRSRLKVEARHQHVLFWGGLRGALALALALALPDNLTRHDAIITITFAVVAFSVFAQGLTITPLLRRLRQID